MTREEAKDYIREWCPYDRQEEIIKALEQEPCEDCISREDTLRAIIKHLGIKGEEYLLEAERSIYKVIKNMPSIQPKPKTDVLDKIRAEIEQLTITKGGDDYVRKMAELFSLKMKVLQIIDKYKAESEEICR